MLEIDIDVGRLVARRADETFKQQVELGGIDGGDAKAITDRRIGRRAAPLAQDAAADGEADDVVDGKEIGGIGQLVDQRQFMPQRRRHLGRQAVRIAAGRPLAGQTDQALLRRFRRIVVDGIFVSQLVEVETAAPDDLQGAGHRLRVVGEQAGHLVGRLQMTLGIGGQTPAGFGHRTAGTDGGQHILQRPAFRAVVMHVIGGDQRYAGIVRQISQCPQAAVIAGAEAALRRQIDLAGKAPAPGPQHFYLRPVGWQQHENLTLAEGLQIPGRQPALSLGAAALAQAQQPAEAAVSRAVGGETQQCGTVLEVETGPHHQPDPQPAGGVMGPHHPGQTVAIGDGDGRQAKDGGRRHQYVGMGGAAQKAEIAGDLQLGVSHQAKIPCRNQRPGTPWRHSQKRRPSSSSTT